MQALKMQKYSVGKISLFFTHCHEHKCCVVLYVKGLLTVLFIVPFSYCDSQVLEQSRKWPKAGAGICVGATHQE